MDAITPSVNGIASFVFYNDLLHVYVLLFLFTHDEHRDNLTEKNEET